MLIYTKLRSVLLAFLILNLFLLPLDAEEEEKGLWKNITSTAETLYENTKKLSSDLVDDNKSILNQSINMTQGLIESSQGIWNDTIQYGKAASLLALLRASLDKEQINIKDLTINDKHQIYMLVELKNEPESVEIFIDDYKWGVANKGTLLAIYEIKLRIPKKPWLASLLYSVLSTNHGMITMEYNSFGESVLHSLKPKPKK